MDEYAGEVGVGEGSSVPHLRTRIHASHDKQNVTEMSA